MGLVSGIELGRHSAQAASVSPSKPLTLHILCHWLETSCFGVGTAYMGFLGYRVKFM